MTDLPRVLVDSAFGSYPNDATYTWTNIHDSDSTDPSLQYARGFSWRRGLQDLLGRMETGRSTMLLRNGDRAWDPQNIASDFYPDVIPDLPFRVRFKIGAAEYPVFLHYADGFPRRRLAPEYGEVELSLSDGFAGLALASVNPDKASLTTSLAGADNDLTFTAVTPGTDAQQITVEYYDSEKSTPKVFVTGNAIRVRFNTAHPATASTVLTALLASTDAMRLVTAELAAGNSGAGTIDVLAATALTGGDSALFPEEPSGDRVNRCLDWAEWPAVLRDVDAGTRTVAETAFAADEQGKVLSHLLDVASVLGENGFAFCDGRGYLRFVDRQSLYTSPYTDEAATFVDGPDSLTLGAGEYKLKTLDPSYDDVRLWNEWTGTIPGGVAIRVVDAASQVKHRRRAASSLDTLLTADRTLTARLHSMVVNYGWPVQRIEQIVVMPGENLDLWDVCLTLDIGHRVRVVEYPPGGGDPNEDVYTVINLAGNVSPSTSLKATTFTFGLWPVKATNYFVIGDATYGVLGENVMTPA